MFTKDALIELLKFTEFTNLFSNIYRKTITNKDGTLENNSQHSFQMAIVGWYICQKARLELDVEKVIKYALVHDLVEVYSGNFSAYSRNTENQSIKDESEAQAAKKIKEQFSDFTELIDAINTYNLRQDAESKFIYALDKFIPLMNIELNNNDFYLRTKTTYEDMLKIKADKIAMDPIINDYFTLLQEYLTSDVKFFWPDCENRDYSQKTYFES